MPDFIDILKRADRGDTRNMLAEIDPYWNKPGGFERHSRADGMTWCGLIETITRLPGESDHDFEQRAMKRAEELQEIL